MDTERMPKPLPVGTQVRDSLNDGLVLTIRATRKAYGETLYTLSDPSPHVPDWTLSHTDILTAERYGQPRWTVL